MEKKIKHIMKSLTRGTMVSQKNITRFTEKKTKYQYLRTKDIQDGVISENLLYLESIDRKQKQYCIDTEPALLLLRNSHEGAIRTAVFNPDEHCGQILVDNNIYILEVDTEECNLYYLQAYLENNQKMLFSLVKNNILSAGNIKEITIPLCSKEEQERIGKKFRETLMKIQKYKKKIKEIWEEDIVLSEKG